MVLLKRVYRECIKTILKWGNVMARSKNLRGMDLFDLVNELDAVCYDMRLLMTDMDDEYAIRGGNSKDYRALGREFNNHVDYGRRIFDQIEKELREVVVPRSVDRVVQSMRKAWIEGGKTYDTIKYISDTCKHLLKMGVL